MPLMQLLSLIPRPVKAVVLVFPWEEARYRRAAEDERIAEGGPTVDGSVFWMKQTVCVFYYFLFPSISAHDSVGL